MKHILMIKKCIKTGLMYLCKTSKHDPYEYKGSGKLWKRHINKHNSFIITCVIGEYDTKEEIKENGIYYSKLYNVVESPHWANLVMEQGDGGWINNQTGKRWKVRDSSKMGGNHPFQSEERKAKTAKEKNWQFKGYYVTPYGKFASLTDAAKFAKVIKKQGLPAISDVKTIIEYCITKNSVPLNKEGRRTPKEWRGKTPKEIGFSFDDKL